MKTAFVTGASGFVGSHAARALVERGWRVRALLRRPERPGLMPEGVEIVAGAIEDPGPWARQLAGSDAILHIAGLTTARTLAEFEKVNAGGVASLAKAAALACPEAMFVLVSSQSAAGPSVGGRPVKSSDQPAPVSLYGRSKLEGERRLAASFPGPWCVVRPSVVYGPGDPGLLQLFHVIARGFAPILAGGRRPIQLISAGDLARVLGAAVERRDLAGTVGFAAGDRVTMGELVRFIAGLRRPPARVIPVPAVLLVAAAFLESARQAATRRPRPFNRDKLREILVSGWLCEAEPFLSRLEIKCLEPWREGLIETLRWYLRKGWVPARFGEL